jgi:hypothetical protein
VDKYGKPSDVRDFANKAQLVNYDQYRALMEGFSSHQWDWYTGTIIWKTQNPWTALRGQMYDYYLDPNACLYGLRNGGELLHVMCNPVDGMVTTVNNAFTAYHDVMLQVKTIDVAGNESLVSQVFCDISPTSVQKYFSVKKEMDGLKEKNGGFLVVRLLNLHQQVISDNIYWLPDSSGNYTGLQQMQQAKIMVTVKKVSEGKLAVAINNPKNGPVAFFNRISLVNDQTKKRILPVFYNDNYVSVLPGEQKIVTIECTPSLISGKTSVSVAGWDFQIK